MWILLVTVLIPGGMSSDTPRPPFETRTECEAAGAALQAARPAVLRTTWTCAEVEKNR